MDRIAITGGAELEGEIPISGAKNSAIKLMVASLLTDEPLTLTNMPRLADTRFLGRLLQRLGVEVEERDGEGGAQTVLTTPEIVSAIAPYDLVRQMRASFNVLGPLLARTGQAKVSLPGGCAIGARPVDLHLMALEALGARIDLNEGYVYAQAPRGLWGADIQLPLGVGGRHRACAAGGGAGSRRDGDRQRRLRAGDRRPRRVPRQDGRAHRGRGHAGDPHRRRRPAARRDPRGDARPDRDRHLRAGRGDGRRRGAAHPHPRRHDRGAARQDGGGRRRRAAAERRPDDQAQRRAALGGRGHDRPLSRLRHRPAGAVHGADDAGRRRERDPRDHLREPLHARAGAGAAGGRHRGLGRRGAGARRRGPATARR